MDIVFREAAEADLPALAALFARAYGSPFSEAEWVWKYHRNPSGTCSVVAERDGVVVASYGGWRTRLVSRGQALEAAVMCDTMTDPSIRLAGRTPVLAALHQAFLRLCVEKGVFFCFGFPNPKAARFGQRFLGYELLGPVRFLSRDLPGLSGNALPPGASVRIADTFPEEHDALAAALHAQPLWRSDRSRATLNWRFHARPAVYYRVTHVGPEGGAPRAYAVATTSGELAQLVDLEVDPAAPEWLGALLGAVARDLAPHGVTRLEVGTSPGPLDSALSTRHGFAELPDSPLVRCSGFVRDDFDWRPVAASLDIRLSDTDVF